LIVQIVKSVFIIFRILHNKDILLFWEKTNTVPAFDF
jgi:hypothetical protein